MKSNDANYLHLNAEKKLSFEDYGGIALDCIAEMLQFKETS